MTDKRTPLDFEAIRAAAVGNYVSTIFPAAGISFSKPDISIKRAPCAVALIDSVATTNVAKALGYARSAPLVTALCSYSNTLVLMCMRLIS